MSTSRASAQPAPPDDVLSWARSHIVRLSTVDSDSSSQDLQQFKRIIGNASVVALGEPGHGIHEFLTFRNRFLRFLVEEMGVTAIAAETGYSESVAVDDYVRGIGELTPGVVESVFSWSEETAYPENRALLDWMRSYNARPSTKQKLHFYGLDLTGGRGGRFVEAHLAIDDALAYVSTVDSAQSRVLRQRLAPFVPRFTSAGYDSLTADEQNSLTATIDDLVSLFERRQATWTARTSVEAYDRGYHHAAVAQQLNENFRAAPGESNPQAQREIAMARNLRWALDREGPQGRVFLFAANWHVSKGPMITDRFGTALGEHLHSMLGKDYVAIGAAYFQSESGLKGAPAGPLPAPDPTSVATMMSRVGEPHGFLALRDIPRTGPVSEWFRTARPLEGGRIDNMSVEDALDAVVFINTVHPAR